MPEKEWVSRELFDERDDRYVEIISGIKDSLGILTKMADENAKTVTAHTVAIEKLVAIEERVREWRAEVDARMDSEREAGRKRMDDLIKVVSEVAALSKDYEGRLMDHSKKIYDLEHKPGRKREGIEQGLIQGILMLIAAALFGFLTNR